MKKVFLAVAMLLMAREVQATLYVNGFLATGNVYTNFPIQIWDDYNYSGTVYSINFGSNLLVRSISNNTAYVDGTASGSSFSPTGSICQVTSIYTTVSSPTNFVNWISNNFIGCTQYVYLVECFTNQPAASGGGGAFAFTGTNNIVPTGGIAAVMSATAFRCTVAGGLSNTFSGAVASATIAGGEESIIIADADNSRGAFIGGGIKVTNRAYCGTIGGGLINAIGDGAGGSTIAGGYANRIPASKAYATIGGGRGNSANGNYSTVGGGNGNTASGDYSTIPGGILGDASGTHSAVGGGYDNNATATDSVVPGGYQNNAGGTYSVVAGGDNNTASATDSSIGGGSGNSVGATGTGGTIPGGASCSVTGSYGFAAGHRAKANHPSAFVWADNQGADFASTASNQVLFRAQGGMGIQPMAATSIWWVSGSINVTSVNPHTYTPYGQGATMYDWGSNLIYRAKGPTTQDWYIAGTLTPAP